MYPKNPKKKVGKIMYPVKSTGQWGQSRDWICSSMVNESGQTRTASHNDKQLRSRLGLQNHFCAILFKVFSSPIEQRSNFKHLRKEQHGVASNPFRI